jgi:hypothetical protein
VVACSSTYRENKDISWHTFPHEDSLKNEYGLEELIEAAKLQVLETLSQLKVRKFVDCISIHLV